MIFSGFSGRWCEKTWANTLANQIFHWGAFKTQIYSVSFPSFIYSFSIHTHTHTHTHIFNEYLLCAGYFGAYVVFTKQLSGVRRHLSVAEGRSQPEPKACPVWWAQPGRWHPAATPGSPCCGPAFPWLATYNFGCIPSSRLLAVALDDKVEHMPSISLCPPSTDLLKGMSPLLIKWPTQYLLKLACFHCQSKDSCQTFPP